MKFTKLRPFGAIALLLGLLSTIAISEEPMETGGEGSMEQDTSGMRMLRLLYYEGHATLDINFDAGEATLPPDSRQAIDEIVQIMNVNPALQLIVECYTDNSEGSLSNQKLAENRAEAVKAAIVEQGIEDRRLTTIGHGPDELKAGGRIELVVKSGVPAEAGSGVQASEHFGVKVYPGAQFDEQQTNLVRNIFGFNAYCYISNDALKNVVAFYGKLEGFMSLGGDETSAIFIKDQDGQMVRIAIANPWLDSRTGEQRFETMIQFLKE